MRDFAFRIIGRAIQGGSAGLVFAVVWSIVVYFFPNLQSPLDRIQSTSIISSHYRLEGKLRAIDSVLTVHEWNLNHYASSIDTLMIESKQDSVMNRIRNIESEIMTGPDKALSLPILRNDVKSIKEDIDSLRDTWNTLIALIVAVALGLAAINFLPKWKSKPSGNKD